VKSSKNKQIKSFSKNAWPNTASGKVPTTFNLFEQIYGLSKRRREKANSKIHLGTVNKNCFVPFFSPDARCKAQEKKKDYSNNLLC
jgi:hypothetical protein